MSDKEIKEAMSCAIRHIGTGVYSSGKILVYLGGKGYDESVCHAAVNELVNTGYIDDRRAARKVLAARSGKKQESRNYMLKRLLEAGIDPDTAEDITAGLECDTDTCRSLYEANYGAPEESYSDREEEFMKLARLRGYDFETAVKAYRIYLSE